MTLKLLFYLFSLVLVFAGVRVITARNPVHAALFLVLAFFSTACLWVLIKAEFLAIVLVLVYVGAVMVLFLFVVMMLDVNLEPLREGFIRYLPVGVLVALLIVGQLVVLLGAGEFDVLDQAVLDFEPEGYSNTEELGAVLYTVYVYPFELAAAILLAAIIAAIALALRGGPSEKAQNPGEQVQVRREDRVRIVKMPAEPKQ